MLIHHLALVPDSDGAAEPHELARVSAAIQRQVTRDFSPIWEVTATVDTFPTLEQVPLGYWPVIVTSRTLGDDEGFHLTARGEPFAVVEATSGWSLTASHEILEMLIDPSGARTQPGDSPERVRVDYLLEICDPCQSAACAYSVNDVLVSDFVLPDYYSPVARAGARFSFGNQLSGPHSLAEGGANTWIDHARGKVVHVQRLDGRDVRVEFDASETAGRALRARVHELAKDRRRHTKMSGIEHSLKVGGKRASSSSASRARAGMFRAELDKIAGSSRAGLSAPNDSQVRARLDSALAHPEQMDPKLVEFLRSARRDLAASVPDHLESYALSAVRSAMRSPVRPAILTGRDVPGIAQYDHEDVRWAKALWEYFTTRKAEFPVCPREAWPTLVHPISDGAVLALAGDWGTHNQSSKNIAAAMGALRPTHTIHLGDVYYAGTEDEERQFIYDWPTGSAGTFALNSNHEMYSGGGPYFSMTLTSDKFDSQSYSYFALESSHWLIIGFDSAFHASGAGVTPYDVGHLLASDPQVAFLKWLMASEYAKRPDGSPKRVCVLSHHQALETDGSASPLLGELAAALGRAPDLWYWGHIHGAAAYSPRAVGGVLMSGRLIGHGGIP